MKNNLEMYQELYVFTNEYHEVIGIYEDDEITEFFNYYFDDIVNQISKNYSLSEFIEYHIECVSNLTKYYKQNTVNLKDDKDVIEFLKLYNEIAPDKLKYEKVTVLDDEIQDFIKYVNTVDDGFKKYKVNNCIPVKKIKVTKPDSDTPNIDKMVITELCTESNIEEILNTLMSMEIERLQTDYNSMELLYDKTDYLRDILDISYKVKNNLKNIYDLLLEFQKVYNEEFSLANYEIKIEFI
ncbi:hypothetical protein [Mammaliicoccus sciuri]|uniref:hypothetical protein n=1 Tax=Mammaliicoccus sciuri TaxID=1296 RepID=UPI003F548BD5